MRAAVETALHHCGRERVYHREFDGKSSIAIQVSNVVLEPEPSEQRVIVAHGADLDEAGAEAARLFAKRLERAANNLRAWAERIVRSLEAP